MGRSDSRCRRRCKLLGHRTFYGTRLAFQPLEPRLMLDGDYSDGPLTLDQTTWLHAGLEGLAELSAQVSSNPTLNQPLSIITGQNGEQIELGDLLDLQEILDGQLAGPTRDYFASRTAGTTAEELIDHLASLPGVVSIEGGFATSPNEELRFELGFQTSVFHQSGVLELGSEAENLGIVATSSNTLPLEIGVDIALTFGLDLNPELSSEESFFIRATEITVSSKVAASLDAIDISVGFFEAESAASTLDLSHLFSVEFVDPDSVTDNKVTLAEIEGYGSQLLSISEAFNAVNLSIAFTPQIGNWVADAESSLVLSGLAVSSEQPMTSLSNFDELYLFNHVEAESMVEGLELFADWLGLLVGTQHFDTNLPFLSNMSVGSAYDPGSALLNRLGILTDDAGAPTFASLHDLASILGSSVDYDSGKNQLIFPISVHLPSQNQQATLQAEGVGGPLEYLLSDHSITVSGDGTLTFDLLINLTDAADPTLPEEDLVEQIEARNVSLEIDLEQRANDFVGTFRYGMVGLEFTRGNLLGDLQYALGVANPFDDSGSSTLLELFAGLEMPGLMPAGIQTSGSATLSLEQLTVEDAFLPLDPTASFVATRPDFSDPSVTTLSSNGIGQLANFESLTLDQVQMAIADSFGAAVRWATTPLDVVPALGLSLGDMIDAENYESIVDGVSLAFDAFEDVYQRAAKLQEVAEIITADLPSFLTTLGSSFADAVVDVIVEPVSDILQVAITFADTPYGNPVYLIPQLQYLAETTGEALVDGVGEFIGVNSPVTAELSSYINIELELDLSDPAHPRSYLRDTSAIGVELYIDSPAQLDGSLGVMDLMLDNGSIVVAANTANPHPDQPALVTVGTAVSGSGRHALDDLPNIPLAISVEGQAAAGYDVVPNSTGIPLAERLEFAIGELVNPEDTTAFLSTPPDFNQLINSIDLFNELDSLPDNVDMLMETLSIGTSSEVFGIKLPIVGNGLANAMDVFQVVRDTFASAMSAVSVPFNLPNVETALESIFGVGNVEIDASDLTDIKLTVHVANTLLENSFNLQTDLGLPALGASLDAEFKVEATYELTLPFGISLTHGVYLNTNDEELRVDADVTVIGPAHGPEFIGRLGFLHVGLDVGVPAATETTVFSGDFVIDLVDPNGDGKLTVGEALGAVGELGSLFGPGTGVTGGIGEGDGSPLALSVSAYLAGEGVQWMPSIVATLEIDWEFAGDLSGGGTHGIGVPSVEYVGVGIDLAGTIAGPVLQFLDHLSFILDPMEKIIDALDTPLPLISDIVGDTSLLSIAEWVNQAFELLPVQSPYSVALDRLLLFIEIVDFLNEFPRDEGNAIIILGDLSLNTHGFDPRVPGIIEDWFSRVTTISAEELWQEVEAQSLDLVNAIEGINQKAATVSSGELRFPIFEDPFSIFGWLLGIDHAEIITWELPSVQLDIPINLGLSFFGFMDVGLYGNIEAWTDIKVGLDTYGLTRFFETKNPLDFFQGFYISDRENADGTGRDVPELALQGKALAGASIGFDLERIGLQGVGVSGSFGGGLTADVEVDLIEANGDGKLRGEELHGEGYCMTIDGAMDVVLEATATVGFAQHTYPLAEESLVDFNLNIPCFDLNAPGNVNVGTLAELNSAGELRLLVGEDASLRSTNASEEDETFVVVFSGTQIDVFAYGAMQSFPVADVVSIIAEAGSGDDSITILAPGSSMPSISKIRLVGGEGNDQLIIDASVLVDTELIGEQGDDLLMGGSGSDIIDGGDGDDEIHGGDDSDTIDTGDGRNVVYGGSGQDTIQGGAEIDIIHGGDGGDTINGGEGNDVLYGNSGPDTIEGEEGDDFIDGGDNNDTILGGDGHDTLLGGNGEDTIDGQDGRDYIEGGEEADTLNGGRGRDTLHGNGGDDVLAGNEDDDQLFGGPGDDELYGRRGDDLIEGGDDHDFIDGGEGDDELFGGDGNDEIHGGVGNDVIYGENGTDEIYGNEPGGDSLEPDETDADVIYGGTSKDTIYGNADTDYIYGEAGDDAMLSGGPGNDIIYGGEGDDFISGDDGEDELYGDAGHDTLEGGSENDRIRGGSGQDLISGNGGDDLLFGDRGNDTLKGNEGRDILDGHEGNDHLIGGTGNDVLYGSDGHDTLEGNRGLDLLYGNDGNDVLYGDAGDDELFGGSGFDTLRGGSGNDWLRGGDDDDLLLGHEGDDHLEGGNGNDVLRGWTGDDVIHGDDGNDRGYGEEGSDRLIGGNGDDILHGGDQDDVLHGERGNDQLYGNRGTDTLLGDAGDDFLSAGDGLGNLLFGGSGNDELVGSDDGQDDPDFNDSLHFGDILNGGPGNDIIRGLGGADVIDAGIGNDIVYGGNHGDLITGGPVSTTAADDDTIEGQGGYDIITDLSGTNSIEGGPELNNINGVDMMGMVGSQPGFEMARGPEVLGRWGELSQSATSNGLTEVGGFEQAVLADEDGVYVAWVDWRNGNSEIYLSFHPNGTGAWVDLAASGGGVSNDPQQSRRPTLAKVGGEILVAWTSIEEDGTSNIAVATSALNWARLNNGGQTGHADHPQLITYNDEEFLLGWLDTSSGTSVVMLDQYTNRGCVQSFLSELPTPFPIHLPYKSVSEFDLANLQLHTAIAMSLEGIEDHDVHVAISPAATLFSSTLLCGPGASPLDVPAPVLWRTFGEFEKGHQVMPTVDLRLVESKGINEITTDVYVAWQGITAREDRIHAHVRGIDDEPTEWLPVLVKHWGEPLRQAGLSSETGYASHPEFAASEGQVFVAWIDDSVHQDLDGRNSIYVMNDAAAYGLFQARSPSEARGRGISATGGAADSLSLDVFHTQAEPYAVWTEHIAGMPQIYLRHDLGVSGVGPIKFSLRFPAVVPDNHGLAKQEARQREDRSGHGVMQTPLCPVPSRFVSKPTRDAAEYHTSKTDETSLPTLQATEVDVVFDAWLGLTKVGNRPVGCLVPGIQGALGLDEIAGN